MAISPISQNMANQSVMTCQMVPQYVGNNPQNVPQFIMVPQYQMAMPQDTLQISQSKQPESTKKKGGPLKAIASAIIPGLGQTIDGRGKTGAKFLGGVLVTNAATRLLNTPSPSDIYYVGEKMMLSSKGKTKVALATACLVASAVIWGANVVDAFKGGKKEKAQKA